jgi:alpha-D-ribose 1-methylphosphonate 5-triphosphate synthase subunit PhnG
MTTSPETSPQARQAAMAVLVHAAADRIAALLAPIELPASTTLRAPEIGLVMVRGRIGGDGAAFNLGEATVTRAAVRLDSGECGFGYTLGRDRDKAKLIALCDALIQTDEHAATIETRVLAPLRAEQAAARQQKAEQTAATKVDFHTLVRGEG